MAHPIDRLREFHANEPAPVQPNAMAHWLAITCQLTEHERREIIRGASPRDMRRIIETCSRYSIPDAVRYIRAGRIA